MEGIATDDGWDSDEVDWDPDMKKLYYDDSWVSAETKYDEKKDWEMQNAIVKSGYMSYPPVLLHLFHDKSEMLKREVAEEEEGKKATSSRTIALNRHGRKSMLSLKEMQKFLKLEKYFKRTKSISDLKSSQYNEYKEYKSLQSKVLQEQEEYQKFLFQLASNCIHDYNHVDPEASKYVKHHMCASAKEIERYERYYVFMKEFIVNVIPFKNDSLPSAIQNLTVSLGFQKHLSSIKTPVNIPRSINHNPRRKKNDEEMERGWEKCVVSQDVNAQKLAIAWNADIVLSHGSLQTLADNLSPFQNEWEIPIVVRTYEGIEFEKKRRIAFIDKALPRKKLAPREKNWQYFKEVFKFVAGVPNVWGQVINQAGPNSAKGQTGDYDEVENDCSHDEDLIMQVDGATDEKSAQRKVKPTQSMEEKSSNGKLKASDSQQKKTHSFIGIRNLWTKGRDYDPNSSLFKPNKTFSQSGSESTSDVFQPFIGRKTASNLVKQNASSAEALENESKKYQQVGVTKVPEKKFESLFFGVLPESALSLSQDEDESSKELKSKKKALEKEIKPEPADEDQVPFTPRRSARNKPDQLKTISKNPSSSGKSSSTAALFAKARTRAKGRKVPTSTPNTLKKIQKMASTPNKYASVVEDESLISPEEKTMPEAQLSTPSKDVEKLSATNPEFGDRDSADLLGKILPPDTNDTPLKKSTKEASETSQLQSNDLLGKILGKPSVYTRNDVTSSWAEDAKSMNKADSESKYSTTDLGLLEPKHGRNVSYTLWKFGKKRVLIRYTLHGNMHVPHLKKQELEFEDPSLQNLNAVSLRTKLEYQSNFVYEQMTASEICRDWITMLIKRPSRIVRARIDPHQRKILDVDWTMTLNHLNDKAEKIGFNSATASKLLTKMFEMIGGLDKGTYICCHRESENKVIMRQSTDNTTKKVVYDLQKEYCNPGREVFYHTSAPWIRGDPHKGLEFHSKNRLIPMTFDPRTDQEGERHGKLTSGIKSSKKRKK